MIDLAAYHALLDRKKPADGSLGFDVALEEINPALKPHVRVGVQWALRGGRRALFWYFGMHKTSAQLEIMRLLGPVMKNWLEELGDPNLRGIVLPLGVRKEFFDEEAARFQGEYAVRLKFVQRTEDLEGPDVIHLMNYEAVREGNIDLSLFGALSLDEAAVLRSFGSKTFGEFLFGTAMGVHFRFVATATPDPNEYLELIAYAHFLGVMDMGEAKTRFFKRDSAKADNLTLHPHKEEEFWLWVSTWAMFLQRPSDLGFSDEGYDLPPLDIRWHEIPTDHLAGTGAGEEKNGQLRMLKTAAVGVSDAAREKRESLPARMAKLLELRAEDPAAHRLIWHDLEAERAALEQALPGLATIYGAQDLDLREEIVSGFTEGGVPELAAKPVMLGSGPNLQRHCHWEIFLGIGHKFNELIQAIHRLRRYGQRFRVRVDLLYTESERPVRQSLEAKWKRHERQTARMAEISRKYGLSHGATEQALTRAMGVERREERGERWTLVNNDSVLELDSVEDNRFGMFLTSIPFSTQYEYSPNYSDFGHTDDDERFWEQMDFLTPNAYRTLKPGRILAVHCKDRIVPGALKEIRYQTVSLFTHQVAAHYQRHGFRCIGYHYIDTDVVTENDQTYRLGYSNVCKDATRIGAGLPEILFIFRKDPTDPTQGWADERVWKDKREWDRKAKRWSTADGYSCARWQYDAHAHWRSSGERLLCAEDLRGLELHQVVKLFKRYSLENAYDHERVVAIAEAMDEAGKLRHDFFVAPPQSWGRYIWSDIFRAGTLNSDLARRNREKHICPLQFDVVDRAIALYSNPGDEVGDFFSGIGTVPIRAMKLGRVGWGCELAGRYWDESVWFARREQRGLSQPTLHGLEEITQEEAA